MMDVVAVLDTIWGSRKSPAFFRINPYNFSGKRLYKMVGDRDLWVTNVCREGGEHANFHGKPDKSWLGENLSRIEVSLLLVCGKQAQETFRQIPVDKIKAERILLLPHPAARNWTSKALSQASELCLGGQGEFFIFDGELKARFPATS